ncbi:hypothetical protein BGX27_009723 [Mortierella sp. AM989]|nr:hypothetical protein BGX27_009723 [Mortierella sp. AM989]
MKICATILLGLIASQCQALQVPFVYRNHAHNKQPVYNDFEEYSGPPRTSDSLIRELVRVHGDKVVNATGMKSYAINKAPGRLWRVGGTEYCRSEIGPVTPIGDALACDSQSPSACQLDITFVDTQSFKHTVGFVAQYEISGKGGMPGVFEASTTWTFGSSYSYEKEYSRGRELKYSFPVSPGRTCIPSHVAYRQSCTGTLWEAKNDRWDWMCDELTDIDFRDKHKFFYLQGEDNWFHYVAVRSDKTVLYSIRTKNEFVPTSCYDVDYKIQVRTLTVINTNADAKASLEFDNGNSISATTCVYQ